METVIGPPVSDIDPFCAAFFENPVPAYAALREAGPVVRLSRYEVWGVARYEQVHAVRDYQEFCAGLGMMGTKDPAHAAPQRASYP